MEANNFNSIELNNSINFEDLFEQVTTAVTYLLGFCGETEDSCTAKVVGCPLSLIQQMMAQQLKNKQ